MGAVGPHSALDSQKCFFDYLSSIPQQLKDNFVRDFRYQFADMLGENQKPSGLGGPSP